MAGNEYFNEPLARHTTFRIGGSAERLVVPSSRDELVEILTACRRTRTSTFVMGRGSNLLVKDSGVKGVVIKNTESCRELDWNGKYVRAGSSVPLQKLVKFCVENGRVGMEYLYSVPGNVGGAICMNAGRGEAFNQSISDHLVSAEIFDGERVRTITKEEGSFSYRTSVFQTMKHWIILSALFELPGQERDVGEQLIRERLALAREKHDLGHPSAGTVFKRYFRPLPEIIGHRIGNAQFSAKTPGWIINLGGATCSDVAALIKYAKDCHKRHKIRVPEMEVVVMPQSRWDKLWSSYK